MLILQKNTFIFQLYVVVKFLMTEGGLGRLFSAPRKFLVSWFAWVYTVYFHCLGLCSVWILWQFFFFLNCYTPNRQYFQAGGDFWISVQSAVTIHACSTYGGCYGYQSGICRFWPFSVFNSIFWPAVIAFV